MNNFLLLCMFAWMGVLIPFDPQRKNIFYKSKEKLRIILSVFGAIGFVLIIFLWVSETKAVDDLKTVVNQLLKLYSYAEIFLALAVYKKFLKYKYTNAFAKFFNIVSLILFAVAIINVVVVSLGYDSFDVYLSTVPQFGIIFVSAINYDFSKNSQ